MSLIRVFIACSLDGFIAGSDGDLSWLPQPSGDDRDDFGWEEFIGSIGCLLMGRATYDAIASMEIPWPHSARHTLVATTRPLRDAPSGVAPAAGAIDELIAIADERAGSKDVYIDGGNLIRQALEESLIDEIVITLCPIVLGAGIPLFAGAGRRQELQLRESRDLPGGMVQLTYVPLR
jgi:dihydrofolate reductase